MTWVLVPSSEPRYSLPPAEEQHLGQLAPPAWPSPGSLQGLIFDIGWTLVTATGSDETATFQAAHDAGSNILVGPGTHLVTGLNWTRSNLMMAGAGQGSVIKSTSGDIVNLGASGATLTNVVWSDLKLQSASGGGDIIVPKMGAGKSLSLSSFTRVTFQQDNAAKFIYHGAGEGFIDNLFLDCQFQHVTAGSVNPFFLQSGGGDINANDWIKCRCTNSGAHFFYIESTAAASYAYANRFQDLTAEVCDAGILKLLSCHSTVLDNVNSFDNTTTTDDLIFVGAGSGALASFYTRISSYLRSTGALGGGKVDIHLNTSKASRSFLNQLDKASHTTLAIDFGNNSWWGSVPANVTATNNGGNYVWIDETGRIQSGSLTVVQSGGSVGFYGVSPTARQVLATGTGKTVDNVITALQNLGLVSQV